MSGVDLPPAPWLALIGVLAVLLLAALAGWWWAATRGARASRARQRRARRAETDAERFLESRGYAVVERQVTRSWRMEIDGELREVSSRADLLLERDHRLYVADVKSGEIAPRPDQPATRRQLLEYLLAFRADGALVVDMRRRRVHAVAFPDLLDRA